jgi:putative endonuclease
MKNARQKLASWGETFAAAYLQERGYQIIEQNVRTPYGEIDLVMEQAAGTGQTAGPASGSERVTVFVEVKTRRSTSYGYPEQAITRRKREHMLAAAQAYLQAHPELAGDWRVDVVAVFRPDPKQPAIVDHFENAIHDD